MAKRKSGDKVTDPMTAEQFLEKFPDAEENENCLQDIACERCGNRSKFRIAATMMCLVQDDGSDRDDESDCEWDSESYCVCENDECNADGLLCDFTIEGLDDLIYERSRHEES